MQATNSTLYALCASSPASGAAQLKAPPFCLAAVLCSAQLRAPPVWLAAVPCGGTLVAKNKVATEHILLSAHASTHALEHTSATNTSMQSPQGAACLSIALKGAHTEGCPVCAPALSPFDTQVVGRSAKKKLKVSAELNLPAILGEEAPPQAALKAPSVPTFEEFKLGSRWGGSAAC